MFNRSFNPMKVLIVKIGAVGDTAMSLSMLPAIDRLAPGSHVTWVCGRIVAPLVRSVNRVDEIIEIDDRKLLKGGWLGALLVLVPVWAKLLGRRFDLIITGHADFRYRLLSLTAWGTNRRGFGKGGDGRRPLPGNYHAEEYARLVSATGASSDYTPGIPPIRVPLPQAFSDQLDRNKKIVALAPGGAKNILRDDALRRWPLENYALLAGKLLKEGVQVLVTGSAEDAWVRESFQGLPVVDWVGQTSLIELVALYGQCDLVITHDSGPMHLAIASGAKVLALFGPTTPSEKVPVNERVHVIWGGEHLACRPCYDGRNYADCSDNQCLKSISVEKVWIDSAQFLFEGRPRSRAGILKKFPSSPE